MKKILAALAVTAAVLLPAAPAQAHAQLVGSDPARDATLTGAPTAVTLTFSERLNPDFTTVVISDAAKQRVATSATAIDGSASTVTTNCRFMGWAKTRAMSIGSACYVS